MQLVLTGVHQRTAPVALRERLAFGAEELCGALRALRSYADEGFIVSTCNRVEVYGVFADDQPGAARLQRFLADWHFLPAEQFAPYLYSYSDQAAVNHLFQLAAGLDSMVLGEGEILSQLKGSLASAHAAGSIGPVAYRLLHSALAGGKLIRSDTEIGQNHVSVVSVAIDAARRLVGELPEQRCLVIGAGATAELALKHLRSHQAGAITITNRSAPRAEHLAERYGAHTWPLTELGAALAASDVVISCTSAPGPLVDLPLAAQALRGRQSPLVLLDLAVPRDIDRAVGELQGVTLIDIDDLQSIANANRAARAAEVAAAEALLEGEIGKFQAWLDAQQVVPTIRALRERAETIRNAEVQRTLARYPGLDGMERQAIEALTSAIVNKLLHHPIATLKRSGDAETAQLVSQLFELS